MEEIQDPQSMAELEMLWSVSSRPVREELPKRLTSRYMEMAARGILTLMLVGAVLLCCPTKLKI